MIVKELRHNIIQVRTGYAGVLTTLHPLYVHAVELLRAKGYTIDTTPFFKVPERFNADRPRLAVGINRPRRLCKERILYFRIKVPNHPPQYNSTP